MMSLTLSVDRNLLDPNFEGYKLSLESLAVFSKKLPSDVHVVARTPVPDQYSYQHAKLFGRANLLVRDPECQDKVYLMDTKQVSVAAVELQNNTPDVVQVWSSPNQDLYTPGDYNPSLAFASANLALVGDGRGRLFILETGDRKQDSRQWKLTFNEEIMGKKRPFIVETAVFVDEQLHCLLSFVEEKESVEGLDVSKIPNKVNCVNVVEWMTFSVNESTWNLERVRRFAFFGSLDFMSILPGAEKFACLTEKSFKYIFDSNGMVDMEVDEPETQDKTESELGQKKFFWHQGVEDMVVWVKVPEDIVKREIKVVLKPRELNIIVRGITVVSGELWNVLDSDSMTWTFQNGKLEINICKANEGLVWQKLYKEPEVDDQGEELTNPSHIDEALKVASAPTEDAPAPLPAYNAQELEACDDLPEEDFSLFIISGGDGKLIKKADVSGHQWLFNLETDSTSYPLAFCLRHDVDGLIWQIEEDSEKNPKLNHCGTFSALGYVQASKTQRKLTVASPDLSYAAICEINRRIYIYRQPSAINSDLRNRKSGQKVAAVAKQQVVTLEDNDDIHGVVATNSKLIVTTSGSIYVIKIA